MARQIKRADRHRAGLKRVIAVQTIEFDVIQRQERRPLSTIPCSADLINDLTGKQHHFGGFGLFGKLLQIPQGAGALRELSRTGQMRA